MGPLYGGGGTRYGRGVQAGRNGPGDGAVQLHGRGRWGLPLRRCDPDSAGNLYGTTSAAQRTQGVVYKLDTAGHETVLHSFSGGTDGGDPQAGVIRDSAGNLYGTTQRAALRHGRGVQGDPPANETVLYNFPRPADGIGPSPV